VRNYLVYGTIVLHVPVGGFAIAGDVPRELFRPDLGVRLAGEINPAKLWPVPGMPAPNLSPRLPLLPNERTILETSRKLATQRLKSIQERPVKREALHLARQLFGLWGHPAAWWDHWNTDLPIWALRVWLGSYPVYLCLCVVGIFVAWKTDKLGLVPLSWLVLMVAHTAVFLVLWASCRYQVTSANFVHIYAGLGASTAVALGRSAWRPGRPRPWVPQTAARHANQVAQTSA
jgi:hypothetical protein